MKGGWVMVNIESIMCNLLSVYMGFGIYEHMWMWYWITKQAMWRVRP